MEQFSIPLGGSTLSIEVGKLAKQANGSAYVRYGDTVVLSTACSSKPREGIDFFPLTVDYREYTYAAGKIPGGFFKREGRPTEKEILTCRLTDRPIPPLFPKGWHNEVQVQTVVLSGDGENDPDSVSISGASAALMVSDIPWAGPLGAVGEPMEVERPLGEVWEEHGRDAREVGDELALGDRRLGVATREPRLGEVRQLQLLTADLPAPRRARVPAHRFRARSPAPA